MHRQSRATDFGTLKRVDGDVTSEPIPRGRRVGSIGRRQDVNDLGRWCVMFFVRSSPSIQYKPSACTPPSSVPIPDQRFHFLVGWFSSSHEPHHCPSCPSDVLDDDDDVAAPQSTLPVGVRGTPLSSSTNSPLHHNIIFIIIVIVIVVSGG